MNQLIPILRNITPLRKIIQALDVSEKPEMRGTSRGLWIEPGQLITLINGWIIAEWAIRTSQRIRPMLERRNKAGAKQAYSDSSVLLTVIVMRVWRKGYESFTGWLARNPALAHSLGYTEYDERGCLKTISSSQLSRRARQLGFLPFLLFFIALVWQLILLGAVTGRDLIIDASLLKAWYHADRDAQWSYPTAWRGHVFGYKIHTIVCRQEVLPIIFWVTPANAADSVWAIPLLAAVVLLYGFEVWFVRADAAYFTWKILGFIHEVLKASPVVDFNVRRKNKQLVTITFLHQWEGLMGPRSDIERHFAWSKRYFGLKYSTFAP
ncbi:MAG: transposase [Chloroflexota bacterium]